MTVIEALILGAVQGLTEFLPVSSSGHLVLLQNVFGIVDDVVLFSVLLHFATLLAVVVFFFKDIVKILKPPYNTLLYLVLSTIPAVIVMLLLKDKIELLFGGTYLAFGFLITAIVLFSTEMIEKSNRKKMADGEQSINAKKSLIMGIAQSIAVIPGISRSGSTICAGILSGGDKKSVAKFSFLMSMPIIFGSSVVSIFDMPNASIELLPVLVGMAAAFFTALFAIKVMMVIIQKSNYKWFAFYLVIISIITFINTFITPIW